MDDPSVCPYLYTETDHPSWRVIHDDSSDKTDYRDSSSEWMIRLFARIYTQRRIIRLDGLSTMIRLTRRTIAIARLDGWSVCLPVFIHRRIIRLWRVIHDDSSDKTDYRDSSSGWMIRLLARIYTQTDHPSWRVIHDDSSDKTDYRDSSSGWMIRLFARIYTQRRIIRLDGLSTMIRLTRRTIAIARLDGWSVCLPVFIHRRIIRLDGLSTMIRLTRRTIAIARLDGWSVCLPVFIHRRIIRLDGLSTMIRLTRRAIAIARLDGWSVCLPVFIHRRIIRLDGLSTMIRLTRRAVAIARLDGWSVCLPVFIHRRIIRRAVVLCPSLS